MSNDNWNFNINLTGVQPATAGAALETGYYKATTTAVLVDERKDKKGRTKLAFKVSVVGQTRTERIGVPLDAMDNVKHVWRAAMEAHGYTPAEIYAGEITITPATFVNKECTVFYEAREDTTDGYDNLTFLTPAVWEARKEAFDNAPPPAAAAASVLGGGLPAMPQVVTGGSLGGGVAPAAPAAPAGGGLNAADLLARVQSGGSLN